MIVGELSQKQVHEIPEGNLVGVKEPRIGSTTKDKFGTFQRNAEAADSTGEGGITCEQRTLRGSTVESPANTHNVTGDEEATITQAQRSNASILSLVGKNAPANRKPATRNEAPKLAAAPLNTVQDRKAAPRAARYAIIGLLKLEKRREARVRGRGITNGKHTTKARDCRDDARAPRAVDYIRVRKMWHVLARAKYHVKCSVDAQKLATTP